MKNLIIATAIMALGLAACEKMGDEERTQQTQTSQQSSANVRISVDGVDAGWDNVSTRGLVNISDVCSRVCFAVYQNGTRVKYKNQEAGESEFGVLSLTLDAGTYQLLVLGHSGAANPTTTNPAKLQFTNPGSSNGTGFTDTFYYYGTMEVTSSGADVKIGMKRATSMFRLMTTDVKPAKVKRWQFYYTGGSGALDATTGYGCVDSKQSVFVDTGDELTGQPLTFEMYTFLHDETGEVNFTVKAFDSNNIILYTREFTKVNMQRNCITQMKGDFFTNDGDDPNEDEPEPSLPEEPSTTVVQVDPEWGQIFEYTY